MHGRYDVVCPIETAYELAQAWPEAELVVVPDAGHSVREPGIARELVAAVERMKARAVAAVTPASGRSPGANAQWLARSRAAVWHPCTQMKVHESLPLVPIARGEGAWLYDFDGRRYLDAVSARGG